MCYKKNIIFHNNLKVGPKAPLFCLEKIGVNNAETLFGRHNRASCGGS